MAESFDGRQSRYQKLVKYNELCQALTGEGLAHRLDVLRFKPSHFGADMRAATLTEAARRIRAGRSEGDSA
jgi:hypothetical protein